MTYRELKNVLNQLSDYQLGCNLTVELQLSQEFLSSSTGDIRFDFASINHDVLDEDHPVFVVNY